MDLENGSSNIRSLRVSRVSREELRRIEHLGLRKNTPKYLLVGHKISSTIKFDFTKVNFIPHRNKFSSILSQRTENTPLPPLHPSHTS